MQALLGPDWAWVGLGRNDGKQAGEYAPIFYVRPSPPPPPYLHALFVLETLFSVLSQGDARGLSCRSEALLLAHRARHRVAHAFGRRRERHAEHQLTLRNSPHLPGPDFLCFSSPSRPRFAPSVRPVRSPRLRLPTGKNADRFEAVAHDVVWLSLTPNVPGSKGWDAVRLRPARGD
jgi:hypothetical protein